LKRWRSIATEPLCAIASCGVFTPTLSISEALSEGGSEEAELSCSQPFETSALLWTSCASDWLTTLHQLKFTQVITIFQRSSFAFCEFAVFESLACFAPHTGAGRGGRLIQYNDLVIIFLNHGEVEYLYMKPNGKYDNRFGAFWHDDMVRRLHLLHVAIMNATLTFKASSCVTGRTTLWQQDLQQDQWRLHLCTVTYARAVVSGVCMLLHYNCQLAAAATETVHPRRNSAPSWLGTAMYSISWLDSLMIAALFLNYRRCQTERRLCSHQTRYVLTCNNEFIEEAELCCPITLICCCYL
jgi:hypothetical protein